MSDDPAADDEIPVPLELALDTVALAVEGTATGVWQWDVLDDTVRWSANQGPLHGQRAGVQPDGYAAWLRTVHPEDRERTQAIIEHGLADGQGFECEFRMGVDDARWLLARGRISRDACGRAVSVVGLTIDVSERHRRESELAGLLRSARSTAIELQRSLLPERLPAVPGLDVAVRYRPGQDGTEVGGDWYDLFPLADGRVAIVVGDVVGRGLPAAARMGRVRTALRAYALESATPLECVERLDRFADAEDPVAFTTLIVVFLDPRTGDGHACTAGHLAPLLVGDAATRLAPIANGPPIGTADLGSRRQTTLRLEERETLLAYTDGLVEDRAVGLDAGLRRLHEVAVGGGSASDLVERVLAGMGARGGSADDVAIVAVRRLGPRLARTFLAVPGAVAAARREVTSFAAAYGATADVLRDLALAVSEACTNVVVHAYRHEGGDALAPRPMHVTAKRLDACIEVTIADEGVGVRPRGDSPGVGLGLQIIARTAREFDVHDVPGGGARLVLRFPAPTMTT